MAQKYSEVHQGQENKIFEAFHFFSTNRDLVSGNMK